MSTPAAPPVVSLTPERVGAAARVLTEAFTDDPTFAVLLHPDAPQRAERLAAFFAAEMLSVGYENVDVALDPEDPHVVWGVAVWVPPRPNTSFGVRMRASAAMTRALGWRGTREVARFERHSKEHAPSGLHWHLSDIAVSPEAQGRGVGRSLLTHRLAVVDTDGLPAALEATTEGSRRLYERLGFVTTHTLSPEVGGAFVMVRQPRAAEQGDGEPDTA